MKIKEFKLERFFAEYEFNASSFKPQYLLPAQLYVFQQQFLSLKDCRYFFHNRA